MGAFLKAEDVRMSLIAPVCTDRYPDLPSSVEWLENAAHHAAHRESSQSSLEQGNQTVVKHGFAASEDAHKASSRR